MGGRLTKKEIGGFMLCFLKALGALAGMLFVIGILGVFKYL